MIYDKITPQNMHFVLAYDSRDKPSICSHKSWSFTYDPNLQTNYFEHIDIRGLTVYATPYYEDASGIVISAYDNSGIDLDFPVRLIELSRPINTKAYIQIMRPLLDMVESMYSGEG